MGSATVKTVMSSDGLVLRRRLLAVNDTHSDTAIAQCQKKIVSMRNSGWTTGNCPPLPFLCILQQPPTLQQLQHPVDRMMKTCSPPFSKSRPRGGSGRVGVVLDARAPVQMSNKRNGPFRLPTAAGSAALRCVVLKRTDAIPALLVLEEAAPNVSMNSK